MNEFFLFGVMLGAIAKLVFFVSHLQRQLNKLEGKVHQMYLLSIEATFEEEKRKNKDILEDEMIPLVPLQTIHAKAHINNINYDKIYPILDNGDYDEIDHNE